MIRENHYCIGKQTNILGVSLYLWNVQIEGHFFLAYYQFFCFFCSVQASEIGEWKSVASLVFNDWSSWR